MYMILKELIEIKRKAKKLLKKLGTSSKNVLEIATKSGIVQPQLFGCWSRIITIYFLLKDILHFIYFTNTTMTVLLLRNLVLNIIRTFQCAILLNFFSDINTSMKYFERRFIYFMKYTLLLTLITILIWLLFTLLTTLLIQYN